jgi:hypothetical protein
VGIRLVDSSHLVGAHAFWGLNLIFNLANEIYVINVVVSLNSYWNKYYNGKELEQVAYDLSVKLVHGESTNSYRFNWLARVIALGFLRFCVLSREAPDPLWVASFTKTK